MSQIDGLIKMMEENQDQSKNFNKKTKIISVVSGKGGVGKSNISTNLAIFYGKIGKKVLIMDADLGLANINVLLNIIPRATILDVINGSKKLTDILISYNSSVDIIPGATGFYQLADLSIEQQKNLVEEIGNLPYYDIIIIDAGAGIAHSVISFVNAADEVLIVTTPEPTALTDAYGMLKVIASKTYVKKAGLIVNMAQSEAQAGQVYQKMKSVSSKFLAFQLIDIGYILDDISVKKSIQKQKPFSEYFPNSKATICVKNILKKIESLDNILEKSESTMNSFLKKIFTFSK